MAMIILNHLIPFRDSELSQVVEIHTQRWQITTLHTTNIRLLTERLRKVLVRQQAWFGQIYTNIQVLAHKWFNGPMNKLLINIAFRPALPSEEVKHQSDQQVFVSMKVFNP